MPPEDAPFDAVQWVRDLEAFLRESLDNLRLRPTHETLVDIAEAQFRLGVATLGASLMSPNEMLAAEVERALKGPTP